MKKQILSLILLGAFSCSTNMLALKMTVKNDSKRKIGVFFVSKNGKNWGYLDVLAGKTESLNKAFGGSLYYFSIDGKSVPVDQWGAYWYLKVQDGSKTATFKYEIYKGNKPDAKKLAKQGNI